MRPAAYKVTRRIPGRDPDTAIRIRERGIEKKAPWMATGDLDKLSILLPAF
jgi:hypothetical protein